MRILMVIILNLIVLNSSFASSVTLKYKIKEKAIVLELIEKNKQLYIDDRKIQPYQLELHKQEFRVLFGEYRSKSEKCMDSGYKYYKNVAGEEFVESGCQSSLRFQALSKALYSLKEKTPILSLKN